MKKLVWATLAALLIAGASPADCYAKRKSKKENKKEQVADTTAKESKYDKLIKGAKTQKGMFTLHLTTDNKLLVEVPDSLMNRIFLLSSRVATTTDPKLFVAGEMTTDPFMIRFSKNKQSLFMHLVQSDNIIDPKDPIAASFDRYQRNVTDATAALRSVAAGRIDGRVLDKPNFVGRFVCARLCKYTHSFADRPIRGQPQVTNNGSAKAHNTILTSGCDVSIM